MAKLYPPGLAGTLPAFYDNTRVGIPFIRNKAVQNNTDRIYYIVALVKNVSSGSIIGTFHCDEIDWETDIAYFNFSEVSAITRNNFYKIQIAYEGPEEEIGYYSTVGVIRYTTQPTITIEGLSDSLYNTPKEKYVGIYSNQDLTEKVYSYRFIITDRNGKIHEDSGNIIHNHDYDIYKNRSTDEYSCKKSFKLNKTYKIIYEVTTVNGLVLQTQPFYLQDLETEPMSDNIALDATLDEENAFIRLEVKMLDGFEAPNGSFIITRASSKDDYSSWREIKKFVLENNNLANSLIFNDYTIEHGYSYKYGIQQYNKYDYKSNRAETFPLMVKFEHMFLFDGERQLKIKFNPKVSNFKQTFQEQKISTLGAKYPYFLRHGATNYKELTINGLISYLSDEQQLFMKEEELFSESLQLTNVDKYKDRFSYEYSPDLDYGLGNTRLDDSNVFAEKQFRDKVMEFLNNGKPKIFKSATEGNLIVRCMNNTLTPNDTLGRMLYTVNSALTEIDDYTWENLIKYEMLDISYPRTNIWFWKTIPTHDYLQIATDKDKFDKSIIKQLFFEKKVMNETVTFLNIEMGYDIYGIDIVDARPGTKYWIDGKPIIIGASGQYQIELNYPIENFGVEVSHRSGWVTIRYTRETYNEFNALMGMYSNNLPIVQQFLGKRNITEELDNSWEELSSINYFNFRRRPRIKLYTPKEKLLTPESVQYKQITAEEVYEKRKQMQDELTYPGNDSKTTSFYALGVPETYESWALNASDEYLKASTLRSQIHYYIDAIQNNAVDNNDTKPRFILVDGFTNDFTDFYEATYYRYSENYDFKWALSYSGAEIAEMNNGKGHKDWALNWYKVIDKKDLPEWDDIWKTNTVYYKGYWGTAIRPIDGKKHKQYYVTELTQSGKSYYNKVKNGISDDDILIERKTPVENYYIKRKRNQAEIDAAIYIPLLEQYFPQLTEYHRIEEIDPYYEAADWFLYIRNTKEYIALLRKLSYEKDKVEDSIPDFYDQRDFVQNFLLKSNFYSYKAFFYPLPTLALYDQCYNLGILYERIENENNTSTFFGQKEQYYIDKKCTIDFPIENISQDFVYEVVSVTDSVEFTSNRSVEIDIPKYEYDETLEPLDPKILIRFYYKEVFAGTIPPVLPKDWTEEGIDFTVDKFNELWNKYQVFNNKGKYKEEIFKEVWETKYGSSEGSDKYKTDKNSYYNKNKGYLSVDFFVKKRSSDKKWTQVSGPRYIEGFAAEIKEDSETIYQPYNGIVYDLKQWISANVNFSLSIGNQQVNSIDSIRRYFNKVGNYETTEFFIVNNNLIGIPKKTYIQRLVQPSDYYNEDTFYRLKIDNISEWIQNNSSLPYITKINKNIEGLGYSALKFDSKDGYELYKNNTLYTLVALDEIHDIDYILRRWVGPNNYISGYFYVKDENGLYIKEKDNSLYNPQTNYYTKGLEENEIYVYTVDKVHGDYTIDNREYINPNHFNCEVKLGINVPKVNMNMVTTEKQMLIETLDMENDIILKGQSFKDVAQLEIGWGVDCIIVYHLRTRNYAFPKLYKQTPTVKALYTNEEYLEEYVNYINNLSDQIFFYREGDNNSESLV